MVNGGRPVLMAIGRKAGVGRSVVLERIDKGDELFVGFYGCAGENFGRDETKKKSFLNCNERHDSTV